jgi:hypothetical protein
MVGVFVLSPVWWLALKVWLWVVVRLVLGAY